MKRFFFVATRTCWDRVRILRKRQSHTARQTVVLMMPLLSLSLSLLPLRVTCFVVSFTCLFNQSLHGYIHWSVGGFLCRRACPTVVDWLIDWFLSFFLSFFLLCPSRFSVAVVKNLLDVTNYGFYYCVYYCRMFRTYLWNSSHPFIARVYRWSNAQPICPWMLSVEIQPKHKNERERTMTLSDTDTETQT